MSFHVTVQHAFRQLLLGKVSQIGSHNVFRTGFFIPEPVEVSGMGNCYLFRIRFLPFVTASVCQDQITLSPAFDGNKHHVAFRGKLADEDCLRDHLCTYRTMRSVFPQEPGAARNRPYFPYGFRKAKGSLLFTETDRSTLE